MRCDANGLASTRGYRASWAAPRGVALSYAVVCRLGSKKKTETETDTETETETETDTETEEETHRYKDRDRS